jgi:hypothetical protein
LEFDYASTEGFTWVIPLSNDKTNYYSNLKKAGIPTIGSYVWNGKKFNCEKNDCLMMMDNGRGHQNYGVAYFWVLF